jgi:hypothetical protein
VLARHRLRCMPFTPKYILYDIVEKKRRQISSSHIVLPKEPVPAWRETDLLPRTGSYLDSTVYDYTHLVTFNDDDICPLNSPQLSRGRPLCILYLFSTVCLFEFSISKDASKRQQHFYFLF